MSRREPLKCVYDHFGKCEGEVRLYPHGGKCDVHRPPLPPTPDPERTLAALQARSGFHGTLGSTGAGLIDDRAIASGRRRASAKQYREARNREQTRKERRA